MKPVIINSQLARFKVLGIRTIINIKLEAILDGVEVLQNSRHQLLIQVGRDLADFPSTVSKQALGKQQVTAKRLQLTSDIAANA